MKTLLLIILLASPIRSAPPQKVYVEWVDIIATDGGWHSVDELDQWLATESDTVYQVGFLYKETKDYIVVIDSYFSADLKGYAVKIPRGCIIKIEKL